VKTKILFFGLAATIVFAGAGLVSCGKTEKASANTVGAAPEGNVSAGVIKVGRQNLSRSITISSELVPFQEIDVYAKESGYVQKLNVDYGSHVKPGDVMAILEIPELKIQLKQDDAAIKHAADQVTFAKHEVNRSEAQHKVLHLEYDRLNGVAQTKPGLVAQQEVDDAQGKDLASEAQVEAAQANLEAAESGLLAAQAKRQHDQALFDYSKITAPFEGVVTQRYANLGTLMQAGTGSSTQALPLVKLSEDDLFRLVIPVPESYVKYIHIGDPVSVNVPSLNRTVPGKVTRFSVDVREETRTMHTEVDVPNPGRVLVPGLYAEATITLEAKNDTLAVPLQAVDQTNNQATVDLIGPGDKIEVRKVTLGIQTATHAEVDSGLQEGDQIVVSDRSGLRPGQIVQVKPMNLPQYQGADDNK
jgi:RND family efflux transporter MFP subunit